MNNRKLKISKEVLENLYKDNTIIKIAEILGVHEKTIRRRFKEFNISTGLHTNPQFIKTKKLKLKRKKVKPLYMNRDIFLDTYTKLKSVELVAEHFNISNSTAIKWKKKLNIPTIPVYSEEGINLRNQHKPYTNYKWLKEAYEHNSITDIAKNIGAHRGTVAYWLRRLGIPTRNVKEQRALKVGNIKTIIKGDTLNINNFYKHIPKKLPRTWRNIIVKTVGFCQICKETEVLDLHHLDNDNTNNTPSNLVVICPNCHAKIHRLGFNFFDMCSDYKSWVEYQGGH